MWVLWVQEVQKIGFQNGNQGTLSKLAKQQCCRVVIERNNPALDFSEASLFVRISQSRPQVHPLPKQLSQMATAGLMEIAGPIRYRIVCAALEWGPKSSSVCASSARSKWLEG